MKRTRAQFQKRRHLRRRQKVKGVPERPRLAVHRSQRHIYAQVIDDVAGQTIASSTTTAKASQQGDGKVFTSAEHAGRIGAEIAEKAKAKGVTRVVFDCGSGKYHGAVKALAEAARKGGLEF